MKVFYSLQHFRIHITNKKNPVVIKIFNVINKINIFFLFLVISVSYLIGYLLNCTSPFPYFSFFQNLFTTIFIIAFFSVRYFQIQMERLRCMMAGDRNLHPINDKITRLQFSFLNLIVPPIAGSFFGVLAILLININIKKASVYYLIILYAFCVFISFLGYLQYIYLFVYIIKLGKVEQIYKYDEDFPANTDWIATLTKLYCHYRNIFFILGSMYIGGVIYFVFCEDFKVIEKLKNFPEFRVALMFFWGGVILAIAIVFPCISIIECAYIHKIIDNLKEQSVSNVNKWVVNNNDIKLKIEKSNLVIAIRNTPTYPFKDAIGMVFSTIVTAVNFAASLSAIFQLGSM